MIALRERHFVDLCVVYSLRQAHRGSLKGIARSAGLLSRQQGMYFTWRLLSRTGGGSCTFILACMIVAAVVVVAPSQHSLPKATGSEGTCQCDHYAEDDATTTAGLLQAVQQDTAAQHRPRDYKPLHVAVFGGSTSAGAGKPKTDYENIWHTVFSSRFEELTGRRVEVSNFARGGTGADFFSTCFERFAGGPKKFDLVLLDFSINGGNVSALVEQIYAEMGPSTRVVLVTQMSCFNGPQR
jgi:hypothetical protein